MRRRHACALVASWTAIVYLAACSSPLAEDVDTFCKVASEVQRDGNLGTTARKLERITTRAPEYSKAALENKADNLSQKLQTAPVENRYKVLLDTAKAAGKSDYKCTSYEMLLYAQRVEEQQKQKDAEAKPDAGVQEIKTDTTPPKQETKTDQPSAKKKKKKKRRH
jgi:hypothetical protein